MKFENLKEFVKNTKCSKSKIYRFYKKDEDLFAETKLKNGKRVFPCDHAKYFNSEVMFIENKILKKENHQMKNLLDCLVDRNSMPSVLYGMEWSLFLTVAYKAERNKKSCFKQMHGLYDSLQLKYGNDTSVRMFFTTEAFTNRVGYHNHFVLHVENKKLLEEITKDITTYFRYDKVDVEPYNRYEAGLFYISKGGLQNEDWDFLK